MVLQLVAYIPLQNLDFIILFTLVVSHFRMVCNFIICKISIYGFLAVNFHALEYVFQHAYYRCFQPSHTRPLKDRTLSKQFTPARKAIKAIPTAPQWILPWLEVIHPAL